MIDRINKMARLLGTISFLVLGVLFFVNKTTAQFVTDTVTLSTDVQTSIAMNLSANTYPFGNLTAGTPRQGSSGIDADVTTNAANGYTLGASDNVAGNDSALLHTDLVTRIADASATIAAPAVWVTGVTKGLGITVFAADTAKEAKWGTGMTYDDALNAYAGVPQAATTVHTSAGYKAGADTTSVAFIVDVDADQKTGTYSGDVTLTATAVLI